MVTAVNNQKVDGNVELLKSYFPTACENFFPAMMAEVGDTFSLPYTEMEVRYEDGNLKFTFYSFENVRGWIKLKPFTGVFTPDDLSTYVENIKMYFPVPNNASELWERVEKARWEIVRHFFNILETLAKVLNIEWEERISPEYPENFGFGEGMQSQIRNIGPQATLYEKTYKLLQTQDGETWYRVFNTYGVSLGMIWR